MTAQSVQIEAFLREHKCAPIEVGLLQPADIILNAVGEDIRRRIFITTDQRGRDLCLRPEFTIPVCLAHIQSSKKAKRYGYHGKVFRQRNEEPAEFLQVGIEDIGAKNTIAADARAIRDCVELLRLHGKSRLTVSLGDQAIFEAVLKSLGLPKAWRERLGRAFGNSDQLSRDLDALSGGASDDLVDMPEKLQKALHKDDSEAVTRQIRAMMRESGLPLDGGRTPVEIAERLLEKARLADTRLADEKREILEMFLGLDMRLVSANRKLWSFARRFNIPLGAALEDFHKRCLAIEKLGLENVSVRYRAGFGRQLDYYTGFVFEISGSGGKSKPLAGGGRYDQLLNLLGSREKVPAVGFAVFIDRIHKKGDAT